MWLLKRECQTGQNILLFEIDLQSTKGDPSSGKPVDGDKNYDPGLPLFSFASVAVATDNFSLDNKLGEGGFGPVFKVRFFLVRIQYSFRTFTI